MEIKFKLYDTLETIKAIEWNRNISSIFSKSGYFTRTLSFYISYNHKHNTKTAIQIKLKIEKM